MRTTLTAFFTFGCLAVVGCGYFGGESKAPSGRVAIIDLDAVAKTLGRDLQMNTSLKQQETSLNEQLVKVQNTYQNQLNEKKESLGEKLSDKETQELLQVQRQANLQLNEVRKQAQNSLSQSRAALIGQFREETKVIARQVASEQGLSIIITKVDNFILSHDSGVDITDEVAKRMLALKPVASQTSARPTESTAARSSESASARR